MFNDIYGEHYSKASISRMLDYLRRDVSEWLERSLKSHYPAVFIDCDHSEEYASTMLALVNGGGTYHSDIPGTFENDMAVKALQPTLAYFI